MRRGRIIIYLALILIVGVVGAILVIPKLTQPSTPTATTEAGSEAVPTAPPVAEINVVFVAQRIVRGTKVTSEYLTYVPYPQDLVVEGMFTDFSEVEGRVARYDLEPNVLLTTGMLTEKLDLEQGSDAALQIDKGKVAVSIPISRLSSISYLVQKGDRVDVIATVSMLDYDTDFQTALPNNTGAVVAPGPAVLLGLGQGTKAAAEEGGESQEASINASLTVAEQLRTITAQAAGGGAASAYGRAFSDPDLEQTFFLVPSEAQRPRLVSQMILRNIRVLQVGNPEEEVEPVETGVPTPEPTPVPEGEQAQVVELPPDVITLIVTPQEAVTLNYLLYSGAELTLALRSANDDTPIEPTFAVTLQYYLDEYNVPVPVKLPYGFASRVDELIAPTLANDIPTPTEAK